MGLCQPRISRGRRLSSAATIARLFWAVDLQVCSFRRVLAEQAIGVDIRAALPGARRVTEANRYESPLGEVLVAGHSVP